MSEWAVRAANSYTYTPFGSFYDGQCIETLANPWKFTGQWQDVEIDQYHLRARQYDPAMMRFTSRDPARGNFTEPATLHRYLYCWNNPVNLIDINGRFPWAIFLGSTAGGAMMGAMGGLLGGVLQVLGSIAVDPDFYHNLPQEELDAWATEIVLGSMFDGAKRGAMAGAGAVLFAPAVGWSLAGAGMAAGYGSFFGNAYWGLYQGLRSNLITGVIGRLKGGYGIPRMVGKVALHNAQTDAVIERVWHGWSQANKIKCYFLL